MTETKMFYPKYVKHFIFCNKNCPLYIKMIAAAAHVFLNCFSLVKVHNSCLFLERRCSSLRLLSRINISLILWKRASLFTKIDPCESMSHGLHLP